MITAYKKPVILVNKKFVNAALRSAENWNTIQWDYHRVIVKKLQLTIAQATQMRDTFVKPATNINGSLKRA